MLMIVFGAGASFDSVARLSPPEAHVGRHPNRPPLTKDIFQWDQAGDLIDSFTYLTPLVQELQKHGAVQDIESALEVWQSKARNKQATMRALLALRFFLQARLTRSGNSWLHQAEVRGATNYLSLLSAVDEWRHEANERVCLVTFNYDTLLDDACHRRLDIRLNTIEGYIARDDFKLFKPHGSVNWGHLFKVPAYQVFGGTWQNQALEMISAASNGMEDLRTYRISDNGMSGDEGVLLPAIAVPLASKSYFECPDAHTAQLEKCIPEVTRLLVIGWRATEKHFLDLWKGKTGQVRNAIVVNGSRANGAGAVEALASAGIARISMLEMGFSKFLSSSDLHLFLSSS